MLRRSFRLTFAALAAFGLAAGCSLVNSLDELKPADDGKLTGETRPSPAVSLEDSGLGPTPITADAEAGTPTGSTFSPLVVGGQGADGDSGALAPVLAVIDSKTGQEHGTREKLWVSGIAHDDIRDLWYIFEAPKYFITEPTETTKIHVRKLDMTTGAWTELSVFEGAPLLYYDLIAVTRERISYIAYPAAAGGNFRMITLNTSDVTVPLLNADTDLGSTTMPRGIVGTPSPTGPGGNVNVMYVGQNANPGECDVIDDAGVPKFTQCRVKVQRYLLPNGAIPNPNGSSLVGNMSSAGLIGFGSVTCGVAPEDVLVLPGVGTYDGTQTILTLDYLSSEPDPPQTFSMTPRSTLLRKVAVDDVRRIVFEIEANNDTQLYAVPLGATPDKAQKANLRHSGQSVYYDPASETAFAPFNQGEGKTFSPYKVSGGTSGAPITLKERTTSQNPGGDWDPPADLRPNILGIRKTGELCP